MNSSRLSFAKNDVYNLNRCAYCGSVFGLMFVGYVRMFLGSIACFCVLHGFGVYFAADEAHRRYVWKRAK